MDVVVSHGSDLPIYEQITMQIKEQILSGALASGEQLPSIRALASDLNVSAITTKRAYADLETAGCIVTVPGKGCFVSSNNAGMLREERLRSIEHLFEKATREARRAGISEAELRQMFQLVMESDEDD